MWHTLKRRKTAVHRNQTPTSGAGTLTVTDAFIVPIIFGPPLTLSGDCRPNRTDYYGE